MSGSRIVAVVVAFRPDLDRMHRMFLSLLPQVSDIVLVDNGSGSEVADWLRRWPGLRVRGIFLGANQGIAVAQNRGIEHARSLGASHVLMMDHDSIPAADMVGVLLRALRSRPQAAAVGPCYTDGRNRQQTRPFLRVSGLRSRRLGCTGSEQVIDVDHLIASGCLIPMPVLDHVGPMREDFFIDMVDIEWSLRARAAGYRLYGVCQARLEHRLGEAPIRLLGREFIAHAPWRHYFHVRNAILVYRQSFVSLNWKLVSAWSLMLKMGFYVLACGDRLQHLSFIWLGLRHGIAGRSGPLSPGTHSLALRTTK